MTKKIKITISVPGIAKENSYLSLRLKRELNNELSEISKRDTILAISDIEGNYYLFRKLLTNSGVIDKNYQWIFGNGHLIILGDCFDNGKQVAECLWLIYSLEERARREGGSVHFILGNHEVMNLNGDWRFVHPKYAKNTSSPQYPTTAIYDGNNELWRWLCTKNIIEKIGNVLFVYGGISPELLQLNLSVAEINNIARPYYTKANELFTDPVLQIIFNSEQSPFWYRGYYQSTISEEQIDATLVHFGVNTIVTGHSKMNQISHFFNAKLFNIGAGHSAGNSEALLIKANQFFRMTSVGKRERIKV